MVVFRGGVGAKNNARSSFNEWKESGIWGVVPKNIEFKSLLRSLDQCTFAVWRLYSGALAMSAHATLCNPRLQELDHRTQKGTMKVIVLDFVGPKRAWGQACTIRKAILRTGRAGKHGASRRKKQG